MRCRVWLAALLLLIPNHQAWAWGKQGHAIIADVAWDHLRRATRLHLRRFLGADDLASISSWADDIRRDKPETDPWHYVNIPSKSAGYQASNCPDDNCVVAQICIFARILGDPRQPFAQRSEALRYLVHFVGDLSQPMHAIADARGGNDIPVTFFGSAECGHRPCTLHSVWDNELIDRAGLDEHQYVRHLEARIRAGHLRAGTATPVAWANSSWRLAKAAWVLPQTNIDRAYYMRQRRVVDRQLALAGLRLARILNHELG